MGRRRLAAVGDLAPAMASLAGRRPADGGQPGCHSGELAVYLLAALSPPLRLSGRRASGVFVFWICRAVPEPEEWQGAKERSGDAAPVFSDLFRPPVRRTTVLTLFVCGLSLTAHWAFLFWYMQQLRELPDLASWTTTQKSQLLSLAVWLVMFSSIVGNFVAAWLARGLSYRRAIALLCVAYVSPSR